MHLEKSFKLKLIFISHPDFLGSKSMPRFAAMLVNGMKARGHDVECWKAKPTISGFFRNKFLKKWLGYIDQYLIFSVQFRLKLKKLSRDTLIVFTDHALGPYIPICQEKPHVIHCHDFLAQKSALGKIHENPTSWTGKLYQAYIHRGYSKGSNFISVSQKTKADLADFVHHKVNKSEVVYNGLNPAFRPHDSDAIKKEIRASITFDLSSGYLLHVGGNQWYKNRMGVIKIYNAWRKISKIQMPLVLAGPHPCSRLQTSSEASPYQSDIHFLIDLHDEFVRKLYAGASLFIFPSLAEGFGWPIAEAMASGCPVITTNEAPMTEVAGDAAFLIPRMPNDTLLKDKWALQSALKMEEALQLNETKRAEIILLGLENAKRFDLETALDRIEGFYKEIILKTKF